MTEPTASRPHMPAYGLSQSDEGLLPWSWAEERLEKNRNYWIGTVPPGGQPHSTAVWGIWRDGRFYFSMDPTSLKARNLAANPRVVVTTDQAEEAVILEGVFEGMLDKASAAPISGAYKAKYGHPGFDFYTVRPIVVFGFVEAEERFASAATKWRFQDS